MNSPRPQKLCLLACAAILSGGPLIGVAASPGATLPETLRATLAARRMSLMEAISRGEAAEVARHFSTDAMLILPGFDAVSHRPAIEQTWRLGLGPGGLARLVLEPDVVTGAGEDGILETGVFVTFGHDGKTRDGGNYLLAWKREEGEWRIFRDIASPGVGPAPLEDRVGFPQDYRTTLQQLAPTTLNQQGTLQTAFGNGPAASMTDRPGGSYPDGSVLVMEFAAALRNEDGTLRVDAAGTPERGDVLHVDVMRRGQGFGEAYGRNRAGEWEFVSYRLDGSYHTRPSKSASCAACHLKAGAERDFVFPLQGSRM
jgi:hypothetical protein